MESRDGIWLKTMNDGVLLFKNIALSAKETDKPKDEENKFEHTEANCVQEFSEDTQEYSVGNKLFHSEMGVFCTVTERTETEEGKLESFKVRLESLDSEATIQNTPEDVKPLKKDIPIFIRAVLKSGSKFTIEGSYDFNTNFKENMKRIFESVAYNSTNFKLFHNDKFLGADTKLEDIYQVGMQTYIYAFESMGVPLKWKRFPRCYEYGTWSCGGSADAISFTPSKAITLAGFQFYVPKEDTECEMNYKITVDGVVVEEGPTKTYSQWEETYFKTVYLENTHSVKSGSKICILIRIAKNLANSNYTNTYYGTDGYSYRDIQGQDPELFTLSYGDGCCNGTSESSGQIPTILYFLG